MNVAERHGVRFEGQYIFEGEGDGPKRIYDWELNVIDPNKFCDYCLFYEIPTEEKCSGPTLKSPPTNVPCSYEPDGNRNFQHMLAHIELNTNDVPGLEEFMSITGCPSPPVGYYFANNPEFSISGTNQGNVNLVDTKPCEKCRVGMVYCYNVLYPQLEIVSWENEIFISVWEEMEEYAGEKTKALMAERFQFILEHETKHHDQFIELYAEPLMNAIDNLNATYHYEYCSWAFKNEGDVIKTVVKDATMAYQRRYDIAMERLESWDAYDAAAAALDAIDYERLANIISENPFIKD